MPDGLPALRRAFVKHDAIAWVATHRHSRSGNESYVLSFLFKYGLELLRDARAIVLPNDPRPWIFAVMVARQTGDETRPAAQLYTPQLAEPR